MKVGDFVKCMTQGEKYGIVIAVDGALGNGDWLKIVFEGYGTFKPPYDVTWWWESLRYATNCNNGGFLGGYAKRLWTLQTSTICGPRSF